MKRLMSIAVSCITALFIVSLFSCAPKAPKANLKTDIDSLFYAIGVQTTEQFDQYLLQRGVEETEKDDFLKGFYEGIRTKVGDKKAAAFLVGKDVGKIVAVDMFTNFSKSVLGDNSANASYKNQLIAGFLAGYLNSDLLMKREEIPMFVQMKSTEMQAIANEKLQAENSAFLMENKNKEGVITLESGLQYKVIKEGTGAKPTAADQVKVKYRGTDIHGEEFDNREEMTFPLNAVISGWTEGIQLMSIGSIYHFYIPFDLGYGANGYPPNIKPYATLIFEVELLDIVK